MRDEKNDICRERRSEAWRVYGYSFFRRGHRKMKSYSRPVFTGLFGVEITTRLGLWYESEAFYSSDLANVARA